MTNKKFPWVTLSSKTVYENNWIRVNHEEVITPGGTDGIYGVVHFKSHAVGAIPIDDDGNTWLVKQTRYTLKQSSWEIPEGGSPLSEDILETAKRELEEECGLKARHWEKLIEIHTSNSVTDEAGTVFVAKDLYSGQQNLEATEDIEVIKLPLAKAIQMVLNGEISDSLSIAGLLKLHSLQVIR
jgi:8-oxo-dGTP pyrophosphatase MutT (NUDIX family)